MIKKIIHTADIHIPNSMDVLPYEDMIKYFLRAVVDEVKGLEPEEARVVLCGDIFHSKVQASNEARSCFTTLLNMLNQICPTIIVAGNHDCILSNLKRVDSITPIFEIDGVYPNVTYIDRFCEYRSGVLEDDNVCWALYSQFDDFRQPEGLDGIGDGKTIIGLYHGSIPGASNDMGYVFDKGISLSEFEPCDLVMCGHIHKYQTISYRTEGKNVPVVYAGSLFQQDYGENIHPHGYVLWEYYESTGKYLHSMKEVDDPYRFYHFKVEGYDDLKEDKEVLLNVAE